MRRGASHEVCGSFSTSTSRVHQDPGLPHPVRSASRVSHPPDGLLLDWPPGLVSCRSAHGVPTLQSLALARSRDASRRPMPPCRSPQQHGTGGRASPATRNPLHHRPRGTPPNVRTPGGARSRPPAKPAEAARLRGVTPRGESVASPPAGGPTTSPMLSWASTCEGPSTSSPRSNASIAAPPTSRAGRTRARQPEGRRIHRAKLGSTKA
jgi:hypothetical protein